MTFASSVAVLFGANGITARTEMEDIVAFETEIANVRQFSWSYYVKGYPFYICCI